MSDWKSPAACCPSSSSSVESCGIPEAGSDSTVPPVARPPLFAPRLLRLLACRSHLGPIKRRQRELTSPAKKDAAYWDKRRKNNEAAKRSREKRRFRDLLLEDQLGVLSEENAQLRAQVLHLLEKCSCAAHSPAFLQADHWAPIGINSPAAVRQQEAATRPFEATIPGFSSTRGGFNPLRQHYLIPQPDPVSISGPAFSVAEGFWGPEGQWRWRWVLGDIPTPGARRFSPPCLFCQQLSHSSAPPPHLSIASCPI